MSDLRKRLLDGPYCLLPKPDPLPGDLRVNWGIALLLAILGNSRGKRASLQKIHFLAHSVRTKSARDVAMLAIKNEIHPGCVMVHVEPWVNRAISFAKASFLISVEKSGSYLLTKKGEVILNEIYSDSELFINEKAFFAEIGPLASERAIDEISRLGATV